MSSVYNKVAEMKSELRIGLPTIFNPYIIAGECSEC